MTSKITEAPFYKSDHIVDGGRVLWREGGLLHFPDRWRFIPSLGMRDLAWEMRPIVPFKARLTLQGSVRGRSAAFFLWHDEAGREFPMFMKDMLDLLLAEVVERGAVEGTWTVRKRGSNYGIAMAKP